MGSNKLLAVLLVTLISLPALAHAGLPKDLKEELQAYADTNKQVDDAEAKQAALLTLGRIGDRDAKKTLGEFDSAEDKHVKLAVDMGLWLAGDRRADDRLVDQLKDDAQLYLTLRDVIGTLPNDKTDVLIEKLVKAVDDAKKRDIFRYLARQHGERYALLGNYLVSSDDKERTAAVEAALYTANDSAAGFAKKMIGDKNKETRADGVKLALGLARRPGGMAEAIEALESALEGTSDDSADKAARYLTTLGNRTGVVYLAKQLSKAEKDEQRQELAEFLLEHHAAVDSDIAKPLMESENNALKSLGFQLAATSSDDAFVAPLRKMFGSTVFDQRIIAVKALGHTGNEKAIGMLGKALFEGNETLRLNAAKGLGRIGHKNGLTFLGKAIKAERNRDIKIAVIEAVSRIEDKQSMYLLRFQMGESDPKIKLAVVKGIRRLGHADSVKALKVVEQDRNLEIKWEAFMTALEIEPEKGLSRMSRALRNPPEGFMADIEELDADTRNKVVKYLLLQGNDASRAAAMITARRSGEAFFDTYRELVKSAATPENVRSTALWALVEKRDDKDKTLFEKLLKDDSKPVQRTAAWTLTSYASKDLEATFRGLLGHDDPAIKSIAAYGLAAVNDE
jgi:HEAT repeat protein